MSIVSFGSFDFFIEFFNELLIYCTAFFERFVDNLSHFITSHRTITVEIAIRISFDDTVASEFGNSFICPMISWNIREFFRQRWVNNSEHRSEFLVLRFQLGNLLIHSSQTFSYVIGNSAVRAFADTECNADIASSFSIRTEGRRNA